MASRFRIADPDLDAAFMAAVEQSYAGQSAGKVGHANARIHFADLLDSQPDEPWVIAVERRIREVGMSQILIAARQASGGEFQYVDSSGRVVTKTARAGARVTDPETGERYWDQPYLLDFSESQWAERVAQAKTDIVELRRNIAIAIKAIDVLEATGAESLRAAGYASMDDFLAASSDA